MLALATSPDGQWAVARAGRQVLLYAGGTGPAIGRIELDSDDVDLAIVHGPPNVVIVTSRTGNATRVTLHMPPQLDAASRIEIPTVAHVAALSGGRIVLLSSDHKQLAIVRAAGRGLAPHAAELQGGTAEFVVGVERNQLVVGQAKKLEVWDAVSGRALRKLALELPPPPRTVGAAAGHLWVTRPGTDEVIVYRLSDGRPFRHHVGAPIQQVISHPRSPLIVMVTPRNLIRLHCSAHSLMPIESPWQPDQPTALAQIVIGADVSLLGKSERDADPWRVLIGANAVIPEGADMPVAPPVALPVAVPPPVTPSDPAADKLRTLRDPAMTPVFPPMAARPEPLAASPAAPRSPSWRAPLASFAQEALRGVDSEVPALPANTELADVVQRLGLGTAARRTVTALYAMYLVGEPGFPIAPLARLVRDWVEPLGQGQLAALALIERSGGKVRLAQAVGDALDGAPPREIRIVGGEPTTPHAGTFRISREGRTDAEIETELAARFGRVAVVEGALGPALVEARLHGATAIAFTPPTERPRPWPEGAGLVLVLYGTASAWIADVPNLESATTATAS